MWQNVIDSIFNDIQYFTSMYPSSVAGTYRYVVDYCDKLEVNSSIMYDEYPDRESIRAAAEKIKEESGEKKEGLVEVLLINEIMHRRIRRDYYALDTFGK